MGQGQFDWNFCAAGILMLAGVWLHVTERHEHRHVTRSVCMIISTSTTSTTDMSTQRTIRLASLMLTNTSTNDSHIPIRIIPTPITGMNTELKTGG